MKFNFKKLVAIIAILGFVFTFIPEVSAQDDADYTITLAHADSTDVYKSRKQALSVTFKNLVESRSGGRVKVDILGGGAAGGEREYVESIMMGSVQAGIASGPIANFVPEAMVTQIPYLFPDAQTAWEVLDGEMGNKLSNIMAEKTNLRNLAFAEVGFRHFTNNERPIKTPEDMEGLKFRVMETPLYVEMVKALGGNPTPVSWNETYSALQNSVVDGQENPVSTIVFANFAEVQKYLTLDGHVYGVSWFVINDDFYNSLPEDLQKIVSDSAEIASNVGRGLQQLNSAIGLDTLQEAGMEIYSPTPEEKQEFREAAQPPVLEWLKDEIGEDIVNDMLNAVEEASN